MPFQNYFSCRQKTGLIFINIQLFFLIMTTPVLWSLYSAHNSKPTEFFIFAFLYAVWMSITIICKFFMISNKNSKLGFGSGILWAITVVSYLIIFNPDPHYPTTIVGLLISLAVFVFMFIDIVDAIAQRFSKQQTKKFIDFS